MYLFPTMDRAYGVAHVWTFLGSTLPSSFASKAPSTSPEKYLTNASVPSSPPAKHPSSPIVLRECMTNLGFLRGLGRTST